MACGKRGQIVWRKLWTRTWTKTLVASLEGADDAPCRIWEGRSARGEERPGGDDLALTSATPAEAASERKRTRRLFFRLCQNGEARAEHKTLSQRMVPWCSGLAYVPVKDEIAGSNPVGTAVSNSGARATAQSLTWAAR